MCDDENRVILHEKQESEGTCVHLHLNHSFAASPDQHHKRLQVSVRTGLLHADRVLWHVTSELYALLSSDTAGLCRR